MDQTPVHEHHNPDLLKLVPRSAKKIIEIGCSSGALAREVKKLDSLIHYAGVEIDQHYAELAKRYCDSCQVLNLDDADEYFYSENSDKDCWIFGDTLEHLKNPWGILKRIRAVIPSQGHLLLCVPNAQHWSLIANLSAGSFYYQESGLLDRTHLRWFTRKTIFHALESTGFKVEFATARDFNEAGGEKVLERIRELVLAVGGDGDQAAQDSKPLQYVIRAVPA